MGDSAHERFNHRKDKQTSRMDEIIEELESKKDNKRGTSIAASGSDSRGVTFEGGDMTPTEMMSVSDQFDVEAPEETKEETENNYMLENQDAIEALDESYNTINSVLESQSWSSLENNPLYDDDFLSHLGNLGTHLKNQVSEDEDRVLSVPNDEYEELECEVENRDYVISVPENEAYDLVEDIGDTLETLSAQEGEETGARLQLLDMYAQGANIEETASELGNKFENIYEADEEFRDTGLLDDEGLTEKGLHVYGTVVAQYEELEG